VDGPQANDDRREVLRQASVALGGRPVTLWEVSAKAELDPRLSSDPAPAHHATHLDVDSTLRRWSISIMQGSRWVGCRLDREGPWVIAPVRTRPPAPPPGGRERRSGERLTLELAGLCDRVIVMSRGRIVDEIRGDDLGERRIVEAIVGSKATAAQSLTAGRGPS